jgi:hypothetical protein
LPHAFYPTVEPVVNVSYRDFFAEAEGRVSTTLCRSVPFFPNMKSDRREKAAHATSPRIAAFVRTDLLA